MVIRRWYPFNELRRMQQGMDQFWRGFPQHNGGGAAGNWWAIPLDVVQEGDAFIVQASMPGVNPADINVSIENDVLTIRGQSSGGVEYGEGSYLVRERRAGAFQRSVRLPDALDLDEASSRYDQGVLTVSFPKVEARQARQLPIMVGSGEEVVEGAKA